MSEMANKAAQEAYVNSLYRMNQEQLIAEVMRVQGEAARMITALSTELEELKAEMDLRDGFVPDDETIN